MATPDQAEETQAAIRAYIKEAVSAEVADKARAPDSALAMLGAAVMKVDESG